MSQAPSVSSTKSQLMVPFANDVVFAYVKDRIAKNTIVSPVGIQTCLALLYFGADGETFRELDSHLKLGEISKRAVLEKFGQLLAKDSRGQSAKVKMANRLFLNKDFQISMEINDQARQYLNCEMVNINLADQEDAATEINEWVELQTKNNVQNIIQRKDLNPGTAAVLVNAMYLKAKWISAFDSAQTTLSEFFINDEVREQVDMMFQSNEFVYGELEELHATGIELPLVDTNISMLILLPNHKNSLPLLEEKLQQFDITNLTEKLKKTVVHFYLPRFYIEHEISLQPVLETLDMGEMFKCESDFGSLLAVDDAFSIGLFKQKLVVEVTEYGTYSKTTDIDVAKSNISLHHDDKSIPEMIVNHPFFLIIKDNEDVYFVGHVAKI